MSDSRARIWFALFVLAVFAAGLAAGVMIGWRLAPAPPAFDRGGFPGPGGRGPGGRPPSAARLIDRLDRELGLTAAQRASIEQIFESRREPLERAQREMRERMEREQREFQNEIRKVLTPEQQPKFDRWLEQDRSRGRGRRGRPPEAPE
jgi:Spy/CpxP family protein refolding chaperone